MKRERELLFLGVKTGARKLEKPSRDLDGRGQGFSPGLAGRQVPPTLDEDTLWLHPGGGPLVFTWCGPPQPTLLSFCKPRVHSFLAALLRMQGALAGSRRQITRRAVTGSIQVRE